AEPADASVRLGFWILEARIGKGEGRVDETHAEFDGVLVFDARREGGPERRSDGAVEPGNGLPAGIEACFQPLDRDGVKVGLLKWVVRGKVALPGGAVQGLAEEACLNEEIGFRFPAKAAAKQGDMHGYVFDGDA